MEHIAIFTDDAIKKIFSGKKTVDSRFSVRRIPPFAQIKSQDKVYIKKSGGRIVGEFKVKRAISYDNLTKEMVEKIRRDYNKYIKADKYFWFDKKEARYGTLIYITEVQPVLFPIIIKKRDRRPWVSLDKLKAENSKSK